MSRRTKLADIPLAVAFDGTVLLGVGYQTEERGLDAVVAEARRSGRSIFVGVVLNPVEGAEVLGDLDDGVRDSVGRLGVALLRGRRPSARSRSRSR
jgi:hypothetical protein